MLPKKMREEMKERKVMTKTISAVAGIGRNTMPQPQLETKKSMRPVPKEVIAVQSHANPRAGGATEHSRATPRVFIPMSDQAV